MFVVTMHRDGDLYSSSKLDRRIRLTLSFECTEYRERLVRGNQVFAVYHKITNPRAVATLRFYEVGFASAAQWYLPGFSQRSGVKVKIQIPDPRAVFPGPWSLGLSASRKRV
jgi:hypothetical protein